MKNSLFMKRLRVTLPCWLGWGFACGSLSWVCALVFDVGGGLTACVAMSLGILTWSLVCGCIAATEVYAEYVESTGWADALRLALKIRAAGTLLGALTMIIGLRVPFLAGLNFMILPDFWAGMVSVGAGEGLAKVVLGGMESGMYAFGVIYLTTLVQGAWVVGSIAALTGVIYAVRRVRRQGVVSMEV